MLDIVTSTATIVNPAVNTAINGFFTSTFEALALLISGGLAYGIKLGISTIKNSIIRAFATRAVAFAGQRLTSLSDDEKRKVVAQKIHDKFPRLPADEVDHFLEEAYVNLQAGLTAANAPQK